MNRFIAYYRTSIGKKVVMAVTGLIMAAYVLAHMAGNLQLYFSSNCEPLRVAEAPLAAAGAESQAESGPPVFPRECRINQYAAFLHSSNMKPVLWTARAVLLGSIFLHSLAATQLTLYNWGSRPVRYRKRRYREADYAARTMIFSGPLIAAFVVYHLLHLTAGTVHSGMFRELDPFHNLIAGFSVWWIAAIYMIAVVVLGLHFFHGLWSWFQTLGWNRPGHEKWRRAVALAYAAVVIVGDLSFPILVLAGVVSGKGGA